MRVSGVFLLRIIMALRVGRGLIFVKSTQNWYPKYMGKFFTPKFHLV